MWGGGSWHVAARGGMIASPRTHLKQDARGSVPLRSALNLLQRQLGVRSVMVEGGTEVIASCAFENAAHRVVLTLAPKLTHGTRPRFDMTFEASLHGAVSRPKACELRAVQAFCLADDTVISGRGAAFPMSAL